MDTAGSGPEGLARLARQDYVLVFTDLMMPEMSGIEVVRRALARKPETAVLMITGFASVDSAVEALKLGALDYIEKPFTPSELEAFTRAALKKKREREIQREQEHGFARLTLSERMQHILLLVSFTALVVTGIPLLFPDLFQNVFFLSESSLIRSITHRAAALILIGAGLMHVASNLISPEGNREWAIGNIQTAKRMEQHWIPRVVRQLYLVLITAVIGGLVAFLAIDLYSRIKAHPRKKPDEPKKPAGGKD